MPKTICVLGNCQAGVISNILKMSKDFNESYTILKVILLHNIKSKKDFFYYLDRSDIILSQPFYNLPGINIQIFDLKKDKNVIVYPNMYFDGYFPFYAYLHGRSGRKLKPACWDYVNFLILYVFLKCTSMEEAFVKYEDCLRRGCCKYLDVCNNSIVNLRARSSCCDVDVTDFIEKKYKNELLFKTYNHPDIKVLKYVSNKILNMLKCNNVVVKDTFDPLSNTVLDIDKKISSCIGLNFNPSDQFFGNTRFYTRQNLFEEYYHFFKNTDRKDLIFGLDRFLGVRTEMESIFN